MTVEPGSNPEPLVAHLADLVRAEIPPMHRAGRPFVLGAIAAAALGGAVWRPLVPVGLTAAGACALFFREPRRAVPTVPGVAVAAADGRVRAVDVAIPPAEAGLGGGRLPRVSVFLSVLDVHVQRAPVDGRVRTVTYRPGAFVSADLDKAGEDNERNTVVIDTPDGHQVVVVQIAGLVARRIVCQVHPDDPVTRGHTYGLIRFGSRVDVYLPDGSTVEAWPGQRTIGGETILARLPKSASGG